jgi:hypothetical protein
MDEGTFDYGTGAAEHPYFYIPASAFCLLFCATWLTSMWRDHCRRSREILPRFAPLPGGSPATPKPPVLIDQHLTFVMETPPPPLTLPPARHRSAQSKAADPETV